MALDGFAGAEVGCLISDHSVGLARLTASGRSGYILQLVLRCHACLLMPSILPADKPVRLEPSYYQAQVGELLYNDHPASILSDSYST